MSYEVLARKWRPQGFPDVVGQGHVTRTLANAIETDHVAHAYLFVGPRGTGKTTTARIFAKCLNCEQGPTTTPCGTCDSCREITAGSHLDVLEIDGASNTGVDNVRELRENVKFAPARGPFKIYIIDEVHMLSIGAFNALLKTLEEPPPHVKFVFATTEPQKVPATILSRCQRFDLRRITSAEIVDRLKLIAGAEEVTIDEKALLAIARGAEGGMRDALSALDQLIAFRGKTIAEEDVLSVFGLVAHETLSGLAMALVGGDVKKTLELVGELDHQGKDLQRLLVELAGIFRNLLVYLHTGEQSPALEVTEAELKALKELGKHLEAEQALRVIEVLTDAEGRLRRSLSPRTILETVLVRCCRAATVVGLGEVIKQLNALKEKVAEGAPIQAASSKPAEPSPKPPPSAPPEAHKKKDEPAAPAVAPEPAREDEVALLCACWRDVVASVGKAAPLAKNYLVDAKPVRVEGDRVILGIDPEFSANIEHLEHTRNRKAIELTLRSHLKRQVAVSFEELPPGEKVPADRAAKPPAPTRKKTKSEPAAPRKPGKRPQEEWVNNPVVRKALEMFNGDIVDIRE